MKYIIATIAAIDFAVFGILAIITTLFSNNSDTSLTAHTIYHMGFGFGLASFIGLVIFFISLIFPTKFPN